jgi:uncharacterized Zn-binding protein involved in type VI secretion
MMPITPNYSGTITSCVTSPSLPTGLSINSSTCSITGTPTTLQGPAIYLITASNIAGSTTASFSISVVVDNAPPNSIYYSASPVFLEQNATMSTLTPTINGGSVDACQVIPALPSGLSISPTTCAITGTPTTLQNSTPYIITATNAIGYASTTLLIGVSVSASAPGGVSYPTTPLVLTKNVTMTATPTLYGGTPSTCGSFPALPTGLSMVQSTCEISGTPTATSSNQVYTIIASNSIGSTTTSISISVSDQIAAPTGLSYSVNPTFTVDTAITAVIPTITGGTPTSCTSSPTLPGGLTLDSTSCMISGTPYAVQSSKAYTITASN